jgi:hypothetical protein
VSIAACVRSSVVLICGLRRLTRHQLHADVFTGVVEPSQWAWPASSWEFFLAQAVTQRMAASRPFPRRPSSTGVAVRDARPCAQGPHYNTKALRRKRICRVKPLGSRVRRQMERWRLSRCVLMARVNCGVKLQSRMAALMAVMLWAVFKRYAVLPTRGWMSQRSKPRFNAEPQFGVAS